MVKIFLQPGASLDTANAQVTAASEIMLRQLPPGTQPPEIINYSASNVPILQLGLSGDNLSEQQLNDLGLNFLRTQLVTVPGATIPYPYGGKQRQVTIAFNPARLQAKGLSPTDVLNAVNAQNLVLPSGTAKISQFEYDVRTNAAPRTIEQLNDLPISTVGNATIYLRDVATVNDGFAPQTNIVRMDGQRGVLVTILKAGNASTIDVVDDIRALLPRVEQTLPPQLHIKPIGDQSIFVKAAVADVVREAVIAACLTALMILLFLGSWRSTLIIAVSIPLSILDVGDGAERARRDDQHHDARRPRARRRHPGRRRDGDDREHGTLPRGRASRCARRSSTARRRSPCRRWSRRCASASCSCRCSCCKASRAICSCRWPRRWCSRCSPPTFCRARSFRRWRCICCGPSRMARRARAIRW